MKDSKVEPVKSQASVRSSKTKQAGATSLVSPSPSIKRDVKPSLVSPSSSIKRDAKPSLISPSPSIKRDVKPSLISPSPSIKRDVKPSLVSPSSSIKRSVKPSLVSPSSSFKGSSRSPFVSQKTSRCVASSALEIKNAHREAVAKIQSPNSANSSKCTGNFILMVELRRKIITFRSIIDLPPLTGYLSITNMVMRTMKDLHKLCPETVDSSQILDMRRSDVDKLLDQFFKALKAIGDSWIDDHEWIIKSKYKNTSVRKNMSDRLVEKVLTALDGLIKGMNERLGTNETCNDDEVKTKASLQSKTPSARVKPVVKQPVSPRTVLNPPSKGGDFEFSVSNLNLPRNVRMQALVKLSSIDVKRLGLQNMSQKEAKSKGDDDKSVKEKQKSETERIGKSVTEKQKNETERIVKMEKDSVKNQTDDKSSSKVSEFSETGLKSLAPIPPPPGAVALPPPPPFPVAAGKGPAAQPPPPPGAVALPPPPPMAAGKGSAAPLPPPPGALPPPPPLPMAAGRGPGAPPPPPPSIGGRLGAKKVAAKLKRTQIGALYRYLTAKIEGKDPEARSHGVGGRTRGGIGSAAANGKHGMAEALAEITKKSPYFLQIEADVQMYMKAINELKTEISKFQSKDINKLQEFHQYIESVLGKLTDESQVLARCEGFPQSKLEAIRMAAALYSKLQGMIKELKNWKIEPPTDKLFDKTERYFTKVRREIETLDQTKGEEEKKFKSHNIHFDFNLLIQIKELMVDISSNCMELTLKEKREDKNGAHTPGSREAKPCMMKNKSVGWAKTLWRAFQFAFRVYTFAGGHDERADKLTRELSEEIKLILKNQSV